jgi:hypothetical protein
LLALTLASGLPIWAAPHSQVSTRAYGNSNINPPSPIYDAESLSSSTGAPLTSFSSMTASDALWWLSSASRAHVQPGLIQLYGGDAASAVHAWPSTSTYVTAIAQTTTSARWDDSFIIDGGALNGTVGHLVAGFQVSGTLVSIYDGSVNSDARMDQQYRAWLHLSNSATGQDVFEKGGQRHVADYLGDRWLATDMPYRAPGLWTIATDFEFGTPIQVDIWGHVASSVKSYACPLGTCVPMSNIGSTVDLGHTMFWDGFLGVTDSSGSPVNDYSLSSDSGFDYRHSAVPVPEPSAPLMMLVGLGLVGGLARRRLLG